METKPKVQENKLVLWLIFLVVLLAYGLFVGVILRRNSYDFSHFIIAGNIYVQPDQISSPIKILSDCGRGPKCGGYDGQFYYRLALDPFTNQRIQHGIMIDLPALRMQRIFYPLTVWILSLGFDRAVPIIMVLANWLALGLIAVFAGKIMKLKGQSPYWGWLIAFYPAFLFSLARDLTEIFGIIFLVVAYWVILRDKKIWAGVLASLAVLSRETTLIFALGFFLAFLWEIIIKKKKAGWPDVFVWLCPISVFIIWQTALRLIWKSGAVSSSIFYNINWPFSGLKYHLLNGNLSHAQNYIEFAFIIWLVCLAGYLFKSSRVHQGVKFAWLIALGIFCLISKSIWVEDWSFMRAFTEVYFFSLLIILSNQSKIKYALAPIVLIMWLIFFKIAVFGQLF